MKLHYIAVDLDAEWRGCDRIQAVLAGAGEPVRILVEGGGFNLPSALMERTGAIRMCLIGYVGESARIVTAKEAKTLTVVEGEMGGTDPAPEQPELVGYLMEEVRIATRAHAPASSPWTPSPWRRRDCFDHRGRARRDPLWASRAGRRASRAWRGRRARA